MHVRCVQHYVECQVLYTVIVVPYRVKYQLMEHGSRANTNSLFKEATEISGSRELDRGYWDPKRKKNIACFFSFVFFCLRADGVASPSGSLQSCLHIGLQLSDDYFGIAPPETPISLKSRLYCGYQYSCSDV